MRSLDAVLRTHHFLVLSTFLTPAELRFLSRTSATCHRICSHRSLRRYALRRSARGLVEQRLRELLGNDADRYQRFRDLIREHSLVLSGSMLLQALLDVRWSPTDLDVWRVALSEHPGQSGLLSSIRKLLGIKAYVSAVERPGDREQNYTWAGNYIQCLNDFDLTSAINYSQPPSLQLIDVDLSPSARSSSPQNPPSQGYSTILEYLMDTFDFSFCKLAYFYEEQSSEFMLHIEDLNSVLDRSTELCPRARVSRLQKRVDKYVARGFTIRLPSDLLAYLSNPERADLGPSYGLVQVSQWGQLEKELRDRDWETAACPPNCLFSIGNCFHLHQGIPPESHRVIVPTLQLTAEERLALQMHLLSPPSEPW